MGKSKIRKDDNKRRRDKNRIKNGGIETRGRPLSGGMLDRYISSISDEEWEFCQAIEEFKTRTNIRQRFISNSEILQIVKKLGYRNNEDQVVSIHCMHCLERLRNCFSK